MKQLFLFCGIVWLLMFASSLYYVFVEKVRTSEPLWYEIGRILVCGFFVWLFLIRLRKEKIKL